MKSLLLAVSLFLCGIANATTYYVSPTGNDANAGTAITTPFKSLSKLASVLKAGDIAFMRGGTYVSAFGSGAQSHCTFLNIAGTAANPVTVQNYPGEVPVFSLASIGNPTTCDPVAVYIINCSYLKLKGLRITNFKQISSGCGISRGLTLSGSNHCTLEQIEIDNIGGSGFKLEDASNDNLLLNCDAHHIGDGLTMNDDGSSDAWDNSDGISCTGGDLSTRNTFEGCRVWLCADDGWDFFGTNGVNTLKNCWSFWNGYKPWGPSATNVGTPTVGNPTVFRNEANGYGSSSGEGFKLGPASSQNFSLVTKTVTNCVSFENRGTGYASNSLSSLTTKHIFYNNIAYGNNNDGFSYGAGWSVGASQVFKNNWAYNNNQTISGANFIYDGNTSSANISNNSWNLGVNLTNADFLSVSSAGVDAARQSDGSLPNLNFLKPATGSRLIDGGINVGLSFLFGAPDIGAFESGGGSSNIAPVANAGSDIVIALPTTSVSLNGSGTDADGSVSSYLWSKLSGPTSGTLTSANTAVTSATGLAQGIYQFQLKVTDNKGATSTDVVQVTVNAVVINVAPISNAGADKIVTLPTATVTITGSGSDADGTIASYLWTKVSGPTAGAIATATAATTNITALVQGVYKFELKVTDNKGATAKDTVQVTVNAASTNTPPVANAGADKIVTLPTATVTITGSGSDADGTIASYLWTKVSGPTAGAIATAAAATTNITALVQGVYKFELKVTDNKGATAKDTVQVTVNAASTNTAPVANAGVDKSITLPSNTVSLTGTGTDANGTITSYLWSKVSGPTNGIIATPATATTNLTALVQGVYKFELKVTDNGGATGRDTVQVTVNAVAEANNAYGGVRWAIPGIVQAENFDIGGQNVAYYDNTNGNNGGVYRTSDYVDIKTSTQENSAEVGWIVAGEWMKYSVNVTSAGTYKILARVACPKAGNSFKIEMDGVVIATITVPNTGSSNVWKTVTVSNISLTAGAKTMRIYASTGGGYDINYIQFTSGATARMAEGDETESVEVAASVTAFPLPFSSSFSVGLNNETIGAYKLSLVDLSGKILWKKVVDKKTVAAVTETVYMGNLANGVYILQVVDPAENVTTRKLLKN